jgi:transposase-like protein
LKKSKGGLELEIREVTHNYRLSKWTEIIRECRSSGQTVVSWCSEHNINEKSYYYWLKRVRTAACEALPATNPKSNSIVPIEITSLSPRSKTVDRRASADITLNFGSITLELHNTASSALIENTLRALQNVR